MYGDTSVIRSLAAALREQADDIRDEADHLVRRVEAVPWSGLAADALRSRVREQAGVLRHTAVLHDDAADALDRHAAAVDRVEELIAAIERRVAGIVEAARDRIGAVVEGADHLLDRALAHVDLPAPGSLGWLHVDLPGFSL